jgi:hypothetical protein
MVLLHPVRLLTALKKIYGIANDFVLIKSILKIRRNLISFDFLKRNDSIVELFSHCEKKPKAAFVQIILSNV